MSARPSTEELSLDTPAKPIFAGRLISLDAFRGLTIFLMVVVNSSGPAVYYQFHHAQWNGWTVADTVFPSFLWIVGVAITLSIGKRLAFGTPRTSLLLRVIRRSAILYLCGLFIYLFPDFDFSHMRITGVLQRIAICYLVGACIYIYSGTKAQIVLTAGLLAAYWAAIMFVPVPGFGAGNLSLQGNLAHYFDRMVLGNHNWVVTQTWDPEGLLSTLPAIATTLLGVLAGHILKSKRPLAERCLWLFAAGFALTLVGSVWSLWLPINKNLWTSSFTLFMAGLDSLILAGLLYLIDGIGYRRWAQPFIILGMNAIAVYLVSELVPLVLIVAFSKLSAGQVSLEGSADGVSWMPASLLQLLYALVFALSMYAFAWFLYRRKWFLRL
jgi:predicted acyltransferase